MRRTILCLYLLAALGGCTEMFKGRVATNLEEAGFPRGMAECMANRWVHRLNVLQLRRIQRLAQGAEQQRGTSRVTWLVDQVRNMNDPVIVEVVSSSAAVCAFR